jgi:hypothetical protein
VYKATALRSQRQLLHQYQKSSAIMVASL